MPFDLSEGERLARRRKKIPKLSQGRLGRLAGVSTGTVLRVEKDRNTLADHKAAVIAALEKEERKRGIVISPAQPPVSPSPDVAQTVEDLSTKMDEVETWLRAALREMRERLRQLDAPRRKSG